ncbi:MAG: hypothetical protein M3137_20430 [Actinomycetota bacterium]|nr:hypothetical protein [Actinomycetota bacterium]
MKRLRTGDEKGAVLVLSVVGVVIACIAAALAVDLGRLASDKRSDQKVADLAALDASRNLRTGNDVADQATLDTAAQRSANRNGFPWADTANGYSLTTCLGKFNDAGTCVTDATNVGVKVQSPFKAAFPFVGGVNHTGAKASAPTVGNSLGYATFSVGSSLVALDLQKSKLDPMLENMLGLSAGKLSLVSYDGLATSTVSLKLLRTKLLTLGYTFSAGTATELLTTNIKAGDLLKATALALTADGNPTAAAELNKINFSLVSNTNVQIGRMLALSQPGSSSALDTRMNVYQLLTGTAQIANGNNFVSVPGVNVTVLGLYGVTTKVKVIEPAQTASGPVDPYPFTIAKNSQVVLELNISGIGTLPAINVDLTSANGKGILKAVNCVTTPGITITPSTSGVTIGGVTTIPLGSLTIAGSLVAAPAVSDQTFSYPTEFAPPAGPTPVVSKRVGASNDLTPATLTVTGTGVGSVAAIPLVQTALGLILPALGPILDPVLQPTLKALGLELSAADLTALSMDPVPPGCNRPHITG